MLRTVFFCVFVYDGLVAQVLGLLQEFLNLFPGVIVSECLDEC